MAAINFSEQDNNDTDQNHRFCDLCSGDQAENTAEVYCTECQQNFCSTCLKFHERNRATKEHQVVSAPRMLKQSQSLKRYKDDISERPKKFSVKRSSSSDNQKCKFHQNEALIYFCKAHKVVTCDTCTLLDHRSCSKVAISDIIQQPDFMENTQDVVSGAQGLLDKFKTLQAKYESYPSEIEQQKETFTKKMTAVYNEQEK